MDRQLNIDGMKLLSLNKKSYMTCSIKPFDWLRAGGHPRSDAVRVRLSTSEKLSISH